MDIDMKQPTLKTRMRHANNALYELGKTYHEQFIYRHRDKVERD